MEFATSILVLKTIVLSITILRCLHTYWLVVADIWLVTTKHVCSTWPICCKNPPHQIKPSRMPIFDTESIWMVMGKFCSNPAWSSNIYISIPLFTTDLVLSLKTLLYCSITSEIGTSIIQTWSNRLMVSNIWFQIFWNLQKDHNFSIVETTAVRISPKCPLLIGFCVHEVWA